MNLEDGNEIKASVPDLKQKFFEKTSIEQPTQLPVIKVLTLIKIRLKAI